MDKATGIIIFCRHGISPRLDYVLKTLFGEMAGIAATLTDQEQEFRRNPGVKLAYGPGPDPDTPFIPASNLLFETGITHPEPTLTWWNETPVLFASENQGGVLPFDLLAASFWLLSRYEEYQPFTPDTHGRFPATASLLHKHGLLRTPLVNLWLGILMMRLKTIYPNLTEVTAQYRFLPTIDVDSAWAYRHKPWFRQLGGLAKAFLHLRFPEGIERILTLTRLKRDPFDTYHTIHRLHAGHPQPIFFFLVGPAGPFNKNQHPENRCYRRLIRDTDLQFATGIHPSYDAGADESMLRNECAILTRITGKPVTRSRNHFLKLSLPITYRLLADNQIREDYTMGYADQPGFRAGTCTPFRFYDLLREEETNLTIFPLTLMDGTLKDYLNLNPEQGIAIIREMTAVTRRHNGIFISLWHNESLSNRGRWKGWLPVYEELISLASAHPDDLPAMATQENFIKNPSQ